MKNLCPICNSQNYDFLCLYKGKNEIFTNKNLIKCRDCSCVYISPMIEEDDLNKYNQFYQQQNIQSFNQSSQQFSYHQSKARIDYITGIIGSLKGKDILDVGASYGYIYDVVSDIYSNDINYTAIELDISQLDYLKKKSIEAFSQLSELPKRQYDLIILSHIIEHLNNPIDMINLLKRFLKKDGYIYIEVPNSDYLYKEIFESHIIFFNITSINELFKISNLILMDIGCFGIQIHQLKQKPLEKILRKVKHFIRNKLIPDVFMALIRKRIVKEKNIIDYDEVFKLRVSGDNRQWIRAIARLNDVENEK
ncbi:MAG: class I SAM-dependent methyltransferase [Nitrospirae bacterium]|nr:class I SAM-dependent methyltransferase [Nitrospirota bacterium]